MTKRKIYARKLIVNLDFYHLAKEFYMYIFRYPELEQDNEWVEIKQLAEKAGISIATLTKMKRGNGAISTSIWVKICNALNCKIDDFLELIPIKK